MAGSSSPPTISPVRRLKANGRRPMTLSTEIRLALKDSKPLTSLFGTRAVPNIKEIEGTVQLDLDARMLSLEPRELSGKGLTLLGRLGFAERKARGSVYVKYLGVPVAVSLTATPTAIALGGSSTLAWEGVNATSCTGSGFQTGGEVSGSVSVSPTETTGYSVTCSGAGGATSPPDTATVTVGPAVTASLSASPTAIATGA